MADQLEENKRNVVAFYDLMFNRGKPAEAVEKYVGDVYVQHNPGAADGKQAFIEHFMKMAAEYPGKCAQFKRVIAEGDLGGGATKTHTIRIPTKTICHASAGNRIADNQCAASCHAFIASSRVQKYESARSIS